MKMAMSTAEGLARPSVQRVNLLYNNNLKDYVDGLRDRMHPYFLSFKLSILNPMTSFVKEKKNKLKIASLQAYESIQSRVKTSCPYPISLLRLIERKTNVSVIGATRSRLENFCDHIDDYFDVIMNGLAILVLLCFRRSIVTILRWFSMKLLRVARGIPALFWFFCPLRVFIGHGVKSEDSASISKPFVRNGTSDAKYEWEKCK